MKVGIFGTGLIAETHVNAIRACGAEIELVAGHTAEGAGRFAATHGLTAAKCIAAPAAGAADLAALDAAFICTPPESHLQYFRACIQSGVPVFCEKPLAENGGSASEMLELAEASGLICAVGFNNRFSPSVNQLKAEVSKMDRVVFIHGHYFQEFHCLPAPYSWRYKSELRALSEIGSHLIDLVRYVTGAEVTSIKSSVKNITPVRHLRGGLMYDAGSWADSAGSTEGLSGNDNQTVSVSSEDISAMILELDNGAMCSLCISEVAAGRSNDIALEVFSPDKSAAWHYEQPFDILTSEAGKGTTRHVNAFAGDTYTEQARAFLTSVETGKRDPRLATLRDGLLNVHLINAIAEAAK